MHLSDIAPNVSFVLRVDGRSIVIGKIHRRRARAEFDKALVALRLTFQRNNKWVIIWLFTKTALFVNYADFIFINWTAW